MKMKLKVLNDDTGLLTTVDAPEGTRGIVFIHEDGRDIEATLASREDCTEDPQCLAVTVRTNVGKLVLYPRAISSWMIDVTH